eukprot:g5662.t1
MNPQRGKIVFVKNLPITTSGTELRYVFGLYGRIDHIDVAEFGMSGLSNNANSATAYIHYSTEAGARAAIENLDSSLLSGGKETSIDHHTVTVSLTMSGNGSDSTVHNLRETKIKRKKGAFFSKIAKLSAKRGADRAAMQHALEALLRPGNQLAMNTSDLERVIKNASRMRLYDTAYLVLFAAQLKPKNRAGQFGGGMYTHGNIFWSGFGTFADAHSAYKNDFNDASHSSMQFLKGFMANDEIPFACHYNDALWGCHLSLQETNTSKRNQQSQRRILQTAFKIYDLMKCNEVIPNEVTYQLMISLLTTVGRKDSALRFVKELQKGVRNRTLSITLQSYLEASKACVTARNGALATLLAEDLLQYREVDSTRFDKHKLLRVLNVILNAIVSDKNCGTEKALDFLERMKREFHVAPDVISLNIILANKGMSLRELNETFINLTTKTTRLKPNLRTFRTLILQCYRHRNWTAALEYFNRIETEGIQPDSKSYSFLVDTAGRLDEHKAVLDLYSRMKFEGVQPRKESLRWVATSAIRLDNYSFVYELLDKMIERKIEPLQPIFFNLFISAKKGKNVPAAENMLQLIDKSFKMDRPIYPEMYASSVSTLAAAGKWYALDVLFDHMTQHGVQINFDIIHEYMKHLTHHKEWNRIVTLLNSLRSDKYSLKHIDMASIYSVPICVLAQMPTENYPGRLEEIVHSMMENNISFNEPILRALVERVDYLIPPLEKENSSQSHKGNVGPPSPSCQRKWALGIRWLNLIEGYALGPKTEHFKLSQINYWAKKIEKKRQKIENGTIMETLHRLGCRGSSSPQKRAQGTSALNGIPCTRKSTALAFSLFKDMHNSTLMESATSDSSFSSKVNCNNHIKSRALAMSLLQDISAVGVDNESNKNCALTERNPTAKKRVAETEMSKISRVNDQLN